ncbi:hypothetical protein MMC32_003536 [Xylographa parallela]|nr:hypothetical protein [Xylographa parallela]
MSTNIKTVGVVGTGVIGASWTALFLAKGLKVIVSDPAPGAEEKLAAYLEKQWPVLERIGVSLSASLSNYKFVSDIDSHLKSVDFVQENAPERVDFKRKLIANIDAKTRSDVIIASSSSGIPSSQFIGDCKQNPRRVLIGHPFNPPHLIPLVEIVPHPGTEDKYTKLATEFYASLGKHPVVLRQESPGFIANRLQAAIGNEAYSLVQRGIVSAKDLDTCVTSGLGLRWALTGPLMTNVLGGGGGATGFKHLLEHLGPGVQAWTKDMNEHAFQWTPENIESLEASVGDWLKTTDVTAVESERDDVIISLMKLKDNAPDLV